MVVPPRYFKYLAIGMIIVLIVIPFILYPSAISNIERPLSDINKMEIQVLPDLGTIIHSNSLSDSYVVLSTFNYSTYLLTAFSIEKLLLWTTSVPLLFDSYNEIPSLVSNEDYIVVKFGFSEQFLENTKFTVHHRTDFYVFTSSGEYLGNIAHANMDLTLTSFQLSYRRSSRLENLIGEKLILLDTITSDLTNIDDFEVNITSYDLSTLQRSWSSIVYESSNPNTRAYLLPGSFTISPNLIQFDLVIREKGIFDTKYELREVKVNMDTLVVQSESDWKNHCITCNLGFFSISSKVLIGNKENANNETKWFFSIKDDTTKVMLTQSKEIDLVGYLRSSSNIIHMGVTSFSQEKTVASLLTVIYTKEITLEQLTLHNSTWVNSRVDDTVQFSSDIGILVYYEEPGDINQNNSSNSNYAMILMNFSDNPLSITLDQVKDPWIFLISYVVLSIPIIRYIILRYRLIQNANRSGIQYPDHRSLF